MKKNKDIQFSVSQPIEKIPLDSKVDFKELILILKNWLKTCPNSFRLDGHDSIGPANPSQVIFFEITDFQNDILIGKENGKDVYADSWNGIYFLTAGCRRNAIEELIHLESNTSNLLDVFELSYTKGYEGKPRKRRLYLKANSELNSGWHCKQYIR